jgi:hypothetical protein
LCKINVLDIIADGVVGKDGYHDPLLHIGAEVQALKKKYLFTCLKLVFTPENNLRKAFNTHSTEIYRISIFVHLFLSITDLPRH